MRRSFIAITIVAAFLAPVCQAAAENACGSKLLTLESVIQDHNSEIPSGSMNRMFTLQDRIRMACAASNDEIADGLIQELAALLAPDIKSQRLESITRSDGGPGVAASPGPATPGR